MIPAADAGRKGRVVVLGASHAGVAVAAELRNAGYDGPITLIGDEETPRYHRPQLSKEALSGDMPPPAPLRPDSFFTGKAIALETSLRIAAIDRAEKRLITEGGAAISYDLLILATGALARQLPDALPGAEYALTLRNLADRDALAEALGTVRSLAVIGGGLIGLEVASAARAQGLDVSVIEAQPQLMVRSLYAQLAEIVAARHRDAGIRLHLGAQVGQILPEGLRLADGKIIAADLVLAAIGSQADDALARKAGLACDDGVLVDEAGQTADPAIFALGDCARVTGPGGAIRHESIAATQAQARIVAATLAGQAPPAPAPLRLWSTQGAFRLQMAGPVDPGARVTLEHLEGDGQLLRAFRNGRPIAVQALDAPRPFNAAVADLGKAAAGQPVA